MYGVLAVAAGARTGACRRPAQQKTDSLETGRQRRKRSKSPEEDVCLLEGASHGIRQLPPGLCYRRQCRGGKRSDSEVACTSDCL